MVTYYGSEVYQYGSVRRFSAARHERGGHPYRLKPLGVSLPQRLNGRIR
jgi:hypothetical protein